MLPTNTFKAESTPTILLGGYGRAQDLASIMLLVRWQSEISGQSVSSAGLKNGASTLPTIRVLPFDLGGD